MTNIQLVELANGTGGQSHMRGKVAAHGRGKLPDDPLDVPKSKLASDADQALAYMWLLQHIVAQQAADVGLWVPNMGRAKLKTQSSLQQALLALHRIILRSPS